MIKEKSCGAVVYKYENGELLFLIEKMKAGHVSIPKGHVENDETEEQTAAREIKEETNLEVELDTNFRKTITFSPYEGCTKDVVFFVAKAKTFELINQECEVSGLLWANERDALEMITHDSDKGVLKAAAEYIRNNG